MSTATLTNTAEDPQTDRVRETMSFSNILSSPSAPSASTDNIDVTMDAPILAPPLTPTKNGSTHKEETQSPATGTETSDLTPIEAADLFAEDTGKDLPDEERGFICMNDESSRCLTGQYSQELSRKVISDHFGRNKACTREITDWPLFCRKHYQRATYNKSLWQIRKLDLIFRQFDVIEADFPGTTYTIALKKSEHDRLGEYCKKVMGGMSHEDAAELFKPTTGKHFEAPMEILREIYPDTGANRTIDEVKNVVEKIHQQITDGATDQVPSVEFLPNLRGVVGSPKKAPKTPSPKKGSTAKTSTSKGTPGRLSAKGSVKKPAQKA